MTHLHLSTAEVTAVRRVLLVDDPAYDYRIRALLGALHPLIPSECLGFGIGDRNGYLEYHVDQPDHFFDHLGLQVCDGPLHTGVEHLVGSGAADELLGIGALGFRDCLRIGFPLGNGRVAQVYFDRATRYFEPRHVELLSMLQPALARLVRPPDQPELPLTGLSDAERNVLHLVSRGATNRDVADQLSVSEATVRKHLEHTYRKLGVSNRTAASALVRVGVPG